jgi:predicted  nucleic acid-binding Zn-ribbon protein
LLVLLPAATSWASETPATYQITAAELTELQDNLSRLQLINDSLRQTCGQQQNRLVDLATALNRAEQQLATAQRQQTALQLQIQTLQDRSTKQEQLLNEANESFRKYAADQKRTRVRIKAQRNTWTAAAGILAAGLALK